MRVTEKIHEYIKKLPEPLQAEVLNFAEFLLLKAERKSAKKDEGAWAMFSLQMAMRGIEDEDSPTYTTDDLKVVFS